MANALENMRREISEAKAGVESAKVLIAALRERLDQALTDAQNYADLQREIDTLSTELSDSTDSLSAAIVEPGKDEPAPAEQPSGGVDQPTDGGPFVPSGDGSVNGPTDDSAGPVENGNVNPGPVDADETP